MKCLFCLCIRWSIIFWVCYLKCWTHQWRMQINRSHATIRVCSLVWWIGVLVGVYIILCSILRDFGLLVCVIASSHRLLLEYSVKSSRSGLAFVVVDPLQMQRCDDRCCCICYTAVSWSFSSMRPSRQASGSAAVMVWIVYCIVFIVYIYRYYICVRTQRFDSICDWFVLHWCNKSDKTDRKREKDVAREGHPSDSSLPLWLSWFSFALRETFCPRLCTICIC